MLTIMFNSIREKIRNKTIYVVGLISGFIIIFLLLNADFTYDNRKFVTFDELLPFAIIMVNFISSMLAIMISLQTIPKDFENKTCHLILVRGIKRYKYMLGLTLSNILTSLFSLLILSISIIIFCITKGEGIYVFKIIGGMFIMAINILLLSAITSLLSIKIPLFINGILGVVIYFLGVFHNLILTYAKTVGGIVGTFYRLLLICVPDFQAIQKEAGLLISGKPIELYPILSQILFLYIVITIILFSFKREV